MELKGFKLQATPAPYSPEVVVEAAEVVVAPVVKEEPVVKGKKAKAAVEVVETPEVVVEEAPAEPAAE